MANEVFNNVIYFLDGVGPATLSPITISRRRYQCVNDTLGDVAWFLSISVNIIFMIGVGVLLVITI